MRSRLAGIALLLLSAVGLLIPNDFIGGSGPLLKSAKDALHVPGFVLVVLSLSLFLRKKNGPIPILVPLVAAIVLAALSELIQPLFNRGGQWGDLLADFIGISIGTVFLILFRFLHHPLWKGVLTFALVVFFGAFARPFAVFYMHGVELKKQFPVLAQFEGPEIMSFLHTNPNCSIEIVPKTNDAPSVLNVAKRQSDKFSYFVLWFPRAAQNWSGFETLQIDLFNAGDRFGMNVALAEKNPDPKKPRIQYNHPLKLPPGETRLTIKLADLESNEVDRPIDLTRLQRLIFGTHPDPSGPKYEVKRIWLE